MNPALAALFVAKLLSTFGSWLTVLAVPWFVLETTGSPARMSAVLAAEFLGVAVLGLPSGRVVGRLGVRRTMLIADATRGPLLALVPVLHLAGALTLPALLAICFGLGAFTAPYVSSQRLILADLLDDPGDGALARANGLVDGATRIAALAGPAAGGVLIALLGPADVLWVDAGTYFVSFLILVCFVRPPGTRPTATRPATVTTGLRHAWRDRQLRLLLLGLMLVTVSIPALFLCLPVLVRNDLGGDPRLLGLLTAVNGAGLALRSLITVTVAHRLGRRALTGAAALQCGPLWLLLDGRPVSVAAGLFLTGLATPVLAATISTRFTLRTPGALRPHTMTALTTAENTASFLGYLVAGPALKRSGVRPVFAAIAVLATAGAATYGAALRRRHASDNCY